MPRPPDISRVKSCKSSTSTPREVLIETVKIGSALRVMAVDAATGTEVSFQAPLTASQAELQRIALAKLDYVMKKGKR